ncbi:hypothetical protein LOK55_03285 [Microbacterium sp. F2E]|uniref:hypothetical protein n=1 Tax=Microbacterium sp. F2E TaxID=2895284 RepID=UPI001E3598F0|nr:hypothetical protein [Microbacterium sp. F2E]MCC9053340.1 hypothetical protein [Microbacterium sp. F2E]
MTSANIATYAGGSADLGLRARLEYAASDAWRVSGTAVAFTQTVSEAFTPTGTSMVPTCNASSGPWYIDMNFPPNVGQQANTTYRAWFAREATPTTRVLYPRNNAGDAPNGWYPYVQLSWSDSRIASYLNSANGGVGNSWVFVQQSVSGGAWTYVAYGKGRIVREGNDPRLYCGWQ